MSKLLEKYLPDTQPYTCTERTLEIAADQNKWAAESRAKLANTVQLLLALRFYSEARAALHAGRDKCQVNEQLVWMQATESAVAVWHQLKDRDDVDAAAVLRAIGVG
jgi:hypothetical protein